MRRTPLPGLGAGTTILALALALSVPSAPAASPPSDVAIAATGSSTDVLERRVIGRSVKGRAIYAYRKGNTLAARKVVLLGQMHGDEKAGRTTARHLIRHVPVSLGTDLWIIPTMNPDGNAASTRTNGRGVDLNRNFPHRWALANRGTVKYSGPRAASEPETRAVMAFLETVRPRYVVSIHQPLYGVDSYAVKNRALMKRLSRHLGLPIRSFSCWSRCRGTLTGWYNAGSARSSSAITVEYGAAPSRARSRRAAVLILKSTYSYRPPSPSTTPTPTPTPAAT